MRAAGTPVTPAAHCRRHVGDRRGGGVEVDGVGVDERVVEQVAADQLVEHGAEQRRVGARPHREEQVGGAGERHDTRVLDDQLGAAVARPPDVARRDRERLGDVRAGDPHDVGERDVAPRVGVAVDAERLLVGRRPPTPCRSGRCSRGSPCAARGGRTCRSGSSSRSSARRPESMAKASSPWAGLDAPDLGDDAVEGARPTRRCGTRPGADGSRSSGWSRRSGWLPWR